MATGGELLIRSEANRSPTQELANAATHGLGLGLALAGAAYMLPRAVAESGTLLLGCSLYLATLLAVFAASSLSHAIQEPMLKRVLQIWDQGLIYFLIVGTYTPFILAYLSPGTSMVVLGTAWTAALAGFASKVLLHHRIDAFSAWSYIALGWFPATTMLHQVPTACGWWVLLGGLCYTVGTAFLKLDRLQPYFHAIWHLLVIAGSGCFYYAILRFVVLPSGI